MDGIIPRHCDNCNNLLELPNLSTGNMLCSSCGSYQKLPADDKRISETYYNIGSRIITEFEVTRLLHEKTTKRINKKCPECDSKIMASIRNKDYNKYIFACPACEKIFM